MNKLYPSYNNGSLDPQAEALLTQIASSNSRPVSTMTPLEARRAPLESSWIGTPLQGIRIEDVPIPGFDDDIILRVYSPGDDRRYPILIFFHGGGFVVGTLEEFDPFCTYVASGASCIVVSVNYRLAPEHKHPAAVCDALTAVDWLASHADDIHGDSKRIAVAGDSCGANLAAVVSLIARDKEYPTLSGQVLICPWIDSSSFETDSFRYFGDGVWLSKANMCWYRDHYLKSPDQAHHPFVSPLLSDDLNGLPPALVITAEFDVLRDQGEAYAKRLQDAGIPVRLIRYNGMIHDFAVLPGLFTKANEAIKEICGSLRKAFEF